MAKKAKPIAPKKEEIPVTNADVIVIPNDLGICSQDRLLVLEDEAQQQTAGGIIIPDVSAEKPNTGTVIAVGKSSNGRQVEFSQGDRVFWDKYVGRELRLGIETYLLLGHKDILWTIKK
jgi:chaperonin GroES